MFKEQLNEKYGNQLLFIQDAYSDREYPDITWRAGFARHAAFLSRMDEKNFKAAYKGLLDMLGRLREK